MFNNYKFFFSMLFLGLFSIANSQSLQELQQMKREYEKAMQDNKININQINDNEFDFEKRNNLSLSIINNTKSDTVYYSNNFFGYNFFTKRDTLRFWENLPPPPNYLLGPGDELIVSLWGETQLRKKYIIAKNGTIYDDKVGLLNLLGKSIEEGENYLKTQFSKVFSTLKGSKPTTYIDVSLGELRSINVTFVGNVRYPGVYPIHPFSNVITGLIQAGGVDTTGSLRKITLKRYNEKPVYIDLYEYLINGNLPRAIQLRDDDILVVPSRISSIKIDSGVIRPAIYESLPGETLNELIYFSGGIKSNSSSLIGIERLIPVKDRDNKNNLSFGFYIDVSNADTTKIVDGDIINISSVGKSKNKVKIIGQVKKPGEYIYFKGMKLSDLIRLSGDFSDSTFWKSVYQTRAELIRRDPNSRYEKVIEINLKNIKNGLKDYSLQNLDLVVVHANLNYFEKEPVKVLGEVNIPGSYPLLSNKETLKSLISRAGGLTPIALDGGISIFRKKELFQDSQSNNKIIEKTGEQISQNKWIRVAWQNYDLPLIAGDSIYVQEATRSVFVEGEVYNPGLIEYQKNKNLNYYVRSAGGVMPNGNKNDIVVIYSNGTVAPKRFLRSTEIKDGSRVIINKKESKAPFDLTAFATSTLSIISTTVTILVLSQQLSSSSGS